MKPTNINKLILIPIFFVAVIGIGFAIGYIFNGVSLDDENCTETPIETARPDQDAFEPQPTPEPVSTPTPTPAPTPSPSPTVTPTPTGYDYQQQGGLFELPVVGATGWVPTSTPILQSPGTTPAALTLSPGQGFTILKEDGPWWKIRLGEDFNQSYGWIEHRHAFINLPDVMPSIIYNISGVVSGSVARSSGYAIPGITDELLHNAHCFNPRLNDYEFIVPLLYSTSRKIANVQRTALENGHSIIIYDAFRPRHVQQAIVASLMALMDENQTVRDSINTPPWNMSWFISTGISNHQRGAAVDVSLGRIISTEVMLSGDFIFTIVTEYEQYVMPTAMHELSPKAAIFSHPFRPTAFEANDNFPFSDGATEGAKLLQRYFMQEGFIPLASEWWHFDDIEGAQIARNLNVNGNFVVDQIYSEVAFFVDDY